MKRKRLDRDIWSDILQKRYVQRSIDTADFCGVAALLCMERLEHPYVWHCADGTDMQVCEDGCRWLQLLPRKGGYMLTAMYSAAGRLAGWYVDMIAAQGLDADGVAWFDDLYLDLIVQPQGTVTLADADELAWALRTGDVTPAQSAAALATADRLRAGLLRDTAALAKSCAALLRQLEAALPPDGQEALS